jgi:hypothetical protein
MALLITFLIFSPRFGDQYLMWALPFLIARRTRFGTQAVLVASAWVGAGELYLGPMSWSAWQHAHVWWAYGSLVVVGSLLLALAGIRRREPEPALWPVTAAPRVAQTAPRVLPARAQASSPERSGLVPEEALTGPQAVHGR